MVGDTTDSNRVVYAVVTATLLATFGWKRRWLTVPAAVTAWPVGLVVFMAGTEFALMLLVFFVTGSLASKFNARVIRNRGLSKAATSAASASSSEGTTPAADHPDHPDAKKGRTSIQVLATGGIPAVLCTALWLEVLPYDIVFPAVLGYFACSCGDTFASEFGELSAETPVLITTLQPAVPGRDGAVSTQGVAASMAGGALIGAVTLTSGHAVWTGLLAGWLGSYLDSLMGAVSQAPGLTLESGMNEKNWKLWNCIVNAASSAAMAGIAVYLSSNGWAEVPVAAALLLFTAAVASQTVLVPLLAPAARGSPLKKVY